MNNRHLSWLGKIWPDEHSENRIINFCCQQYGGVMVPIVVALIISAGLIVSSITIARAIRGESGIQFPALTKVKAPKWKRMPRTMYVLALVWFFGLPLLVTAIGTWNEGGAKVQVPLMSFAGLAVLLFIGFLMSTFRSRWDQFLVTWSQQVPRRLCTMDSLSNLARPFYALCTGKMSMYCCPNSPINCKTPRC